MKPFNDVKQAISWLEQQLKFKPKTDLKTMQHALNLLNVDLSHMKKIHVAGTNGKGSVCHFLTEMAKTHGLNVGTFISPYVYTFNERILINGHPISNDDLIILIEEIYHFNLRFEKTFEFALSFFELLTIMAIIYFKKQDVDLIIMEVGIGGLLDSTNILNYDVSVITSIGFDHMKQLGNTLESIALNKLGILKEGNMLFASVDLNLHPLFKSYAQNVKANLELVDTSEVSYQIKNEQGIFTYNQEDYTLKLLGSHQISNAILAMKAILYLYPDMPLTHLKTALKNTYHPGRFERITFDYPHHQELWLDGAHNEHAMKNLADNIKRMFKDKPTIILSVLGDKDVHQMLTIIKPVAKRIVLTGFDDPRYISLKPFETKDMPYFEHLEDALDNVQDEPVVFATGSIHFIGYFYKTYRTWLKK